jgi:hypothetical protein
MRRRALDWEPAPLCFLSCRASLRMNFSAKGVEGGGTAPAVGPSAPASGDTARSSTGVDARTWCKFAAHSDPVLIRRKKALASSPRSEEGGSGVKNTGAGGTYLAAATAALDCSISLRGGSTLEEKSAATLPLVAETAAFCCAALCCAKLAPLHSNSASAFAAAAAVAIVSNS